jgi:hypothetical protein
MDTDMLMPRQRPVQRGCSSDEAVDPGPVKVGEPAEAVDELRRRAVLDDRTVLHGQRGSRRSSWRTEAMCR